MALRRTHILCTVTFRQLILIWSRSHFPFRVFQVHLVGRLEFAQNNPLWEIIKMPKKGVEEEAETMMLLHGYYAKPRETDGKFMRI